MADRRHWNKLRHFLSPFQWKKWSFLARPKLQIKRHNWSTANQTSKWCCLKDQKGTRGGGGRCLSENRMADSRMIRSSYCLQWTLLLDGWRIKLCHKEIAIPKTKRHLLWRACTDMEYVPDCDKRNDTSAYPVEFWNDRNLRQPSNSEGEHNIIMYEMECSLTSGLTTLPHESRPNIENV